MQSLFCEKLNYGKMSLHGLSEVRVTFFFYYLFLLDLFMWMCAIMVLREELTGIRIFSFYHMGPEDET